MSDDELIEAMARAAYSSTRSTSTPWEQLPLRFKLRWLSQARAALAVAEPVIRERCAVVADAAGNRSRGLAGKRAAMHAATAIRTGGTPLNPENKP